MAMFKYFLNAFLHGPSQPTLSSKHPVPRSRLHNTSTDEHTLPRHDRGEGPSTSPSPPHNDITWTPQSSEAWRWDDGREDTDEDCDDYDDPDEVIDDQPALSGLQDLLHENVYSPPRAWAWAAEAPISHARILLNIYPPANDRCHTDLLRGLIGYNPVTFIQRRWPRFQEASETALFKEFKLLSSDFFLRPLQGSIIPTLINVYDDAYGVSLIMEPPHPTLWWTASSHMPYIVKKRIVDAYLQLHSRKILHGSTDLRHIFVGADCRVMLMDFSKSCAGGGVPELGIGRYSKRAASAELREIMFKLDFEGARQREYARIYRSKELQQRLEAVYGWRHRLQTEGFSCLNRLGRPDRQVPLSGRTIDDDEERALSPELYSAWCKEAKEPMIQFVVPGQTEEAVRAAQQAFKTRAAELEEEWKKESVMPILKRVPDFPLPVPRAPPFDDIDDDEAPTWLGKRKLSSDDEIDIQPLPKRLRLADASSAPKKAEGKVFPYTSKTYSTGTSDTLPVAVSPPTTPQMHNTAHTHATPKPPKVRDFANEAYNGPRGYYFPHPPTEYLMSANRTAHIINANAVRCGLDDLPYYRGSIAECTPPRYRSYTEKSASHALGTLKRQRAAGEDKDLHTYDEEQRRKRRRFEQQQLKSQKEIRPVRFTKPTFADPPVYDNESGTRTSRPRSTPKHREKRAGRSVLKRTRPVKTVSYDLLRWLPDDDASTQVSAQVSQVHVGVTAECAVSSSNEPRASGCGPYLDRPASISCHMDLDPPVTENGSSGDEACVEVTRGAMPVADGAGPSRQWADGRYTLQPTTEELEEMREVVAMLIPVDDDSLRRRRVDVDMVAIGPDKTMLDDICVWLARRRNVDESDIWDE